MTCATPQDVDQGRRSHDGARAKSVRALCTHAVLSGPAYERIADSVLTEFVVTDIP